MRASTHMILLIVLQTVGRAEGKMTILSPHDPRTETFYRYVNPMFMTKEVYLKGKTSIAIGSEKQLDFEVAFSCEKADYCENIKRYDGEYKGDKEVLIELDWYSGKFGDTPYETGLYSGGIIVVMSNESVEVTVISQQADNCRSSYAQIAKTGLGMGGFTVAPLVDENGFVMVISTETYVIIEMDAYGMTYSEKEKLRKQGDKKNPFTNGLSIEFPLKRFQYFLFMPRDYPLMAGVTGLGIQSGNHVEIYVGSTNRKGDLKGCVDGHAISGVSFGPALGYQRNFNAVKFNKQDNLPIGVKQEVKNVIYIYTVTTNTDIEVTINDQLIHFTQENIGDEIILEFEDFKTDHMQILSRVKIVVFLFATVTHEALWLPGKYQDKCLIQMLSLEQTVKEQLIRHQTFQDHHLEVVMMLHLAKTTQKPGVNILTFNDLSLINAVYGGYLKETHEKRYVTKHHMVIRFTVLSRKYRLKQLKAVTTNQSTAKLPEENILIKSVSTFNFQSMTISPIHYFATVLSANKNINKAQCKVSLPLIDDGVDNDCDSLIDEDIYGDGIDNDGDGLIDEDTTKHRIWNVGQQCSEWKEICHKGKRVYERECEKVPSLKLGQKYGEYLEFGKCRRHRLQVSRKVCSHMMWSENCTKKCPDTCLFAGGCYDHDGHCWHCPAGFGGAACTELCPPGMFGSGCFKNCSNFCYTGECHPVFGDCTADTNSMWVYASIATSILLLVSFTIFIHALCFFGQNKTRMWKFREIDD